MNKKQGLLKTIKKTAVSSYRFITGLSNASYEFEKNEPTENAVPDNPSQQQPDQAVLNEPRSIPEDTAINTDIPAKNNVQQPKPATTKENKPQNTEKQQDNPDTNEKSVSASAVAESDAKTSRAPEKKPAYEELVEPLLHEYIKLTQTEKSDFENNAAFEAERAARIAANKERLAVLEQDMMAIIAANAERAASRKQEIEEELRKNTVNIAKLEAEREEMIKRNIASAKERLAELTEKITTSRMEAMRLNMERKLLIETQALKLRKRESFRNIVSRSTKAIEHARAAAKKQQAAAEARAAEIRRKREARLAEVEAALKRGHNNKTDPLSRRPSAQQISRSGIQPLKKNPEVDTRIEEIKQERELRQTRIRETAREKARLEAERRAKLDAERQARLDAVRLQARQEQEKREQELKNRKANPK